MPFDVAKELAAAGKGAVIAVPPGVYDVPGGCGITARDVTVVAEAGPGTVTLRRTGDDSNRVLSIAASGVRVDGITFAPSGCKAVGVSSTKAATRPGFVTLSRCHFTGNFGVLLSGVVEFSLDWCAADVLQKNALYATTPGPADWNSGVRIRGLEAKGCVHEPLVRTHGTTGLRIEGGQILNPRSVNLKKKAAIVAHDGDGATLEGVTCGAIGLGPLRSTTDKRQKNVIVRNVTMVDGYLTLDAGLDGCLIELSTLRADFSGSVFAYPGAQNGIPAAANITIRDVIASYAGGGKLINTTNSGAKFERVRFN